MKYSKAILPSYLNKKILISFFLILLLLLLFLFGNQYFIVLEQSLNSGLYSSELLPMIILKLVRDLPFIMALSYVIALTYEINLLYKNSEAVIISSSGVSSFKLMNFISPLVFAVFLSSFYLNVYVVPIVKNQIENLKISASSRPDYIFFKEGIFQKFQDDDISFYASEIVTNDIGDQDLKNVFIFFHKDGRLVLSETAKKISNNNKVILKLSYGKIYENLAKNNLNPIITNFQNYDLKLFDSSNTKSNYIDSIESMKFNELLFSDKKNEQVEAVFRISIPFALVLLTFFCILISRTNPRKKRNFSIGYAIVMFLTYYNSILIIKKIQEDIEDLYLTLAFLPHLVFLLFCFLIYKYKFKFS